MTDEELMQRVKEGDMYAFDMLVRRWEHKLFNLIYRITGEFETAKDICQEAFLKVYQSAKRYRSKGQFETWLYRIAINCSMNELKRRKHRQTLSLTAPLDNRQKLEEALIDPRPQPEEVAQQNETAKLIQNALIRLPEEQRIVVVLRHYEGLKFQQIASILNCPLGTVKSRIYAGLERLRMMLKDLKV